MPSASGMLVESELLAAMGLKKNRRGKIVDMVKSAASARVFKTSAFGKWNASVKRARMEFRLKGFAAVKKPSPLYNLAMIHYRAEMGLDALPVEEVD